MSLAIDAILRERFPGLEALLVAVGDLKIRERDERLDAFANLLITEIREQLDLATLKDEPRLRAYRDFYWRVGIDPTKTRPAAEALIRRVLQGHPFPRINALVDAYNLASMKMRISIAAFDRAGVRGELTMRLAWAGEKFRGIGMSEPAILSGHEVVVQDAEALVALYPYRDAEATKVTVAARDVLFMICGVPGIPREVLVEAASTMEQLVDRFCR